MKNVVRPSVNYLAPDVCLPESVSSLLRDVLEAGFIKPMWIGPVAPVRECVVAVVAELEKKFHVFPLEQSPETCIRAVQRKADGLLYQDGPYLPGDIWMDLLDDDHTPEVMGQLLVNTGLACGYFRREGDPSVAIRTENRVNYKTDSKLPFYHLRPWANPTMLVKMMRNPRCLMDDPYTDEQASLMTHWDVIGPEDMHRAELDFSRFIRYGYYEVEPGVFIQLRTAALHSPETLPKLREDVHRLKRYLSHLQDRQR